MEYHTCQHVLKSGEICNQKTRKEFCRYHTNNKNQCQYPNCIRNCRQNFCNFHKPETMEAKRRRERARYQAIVV